MAVERIKRINEMIRRELAAGIARIGRGGDEAAEKISVVAAEVSHDLRGCGVMVSIMAQPGEAARLMAWLRRRRVDLQALIARNIALKYTPKLFFKQTCAIAKGDRVLEILGGLGGADGRPPEGAEPPAAPES